MAKHWFISTAAAILLVAGISKIVSGLGHASILERIDPLFHLQFRFLMLGVGTLELIVVVFCIIGCDQMRKIIVLTWLTTTLLIYRIGLWWVGWHRPCSCLGNLTDALHVRPQTADTVMKIILGYLLIGSYASLFWLWRLKRTAVSATVLAGPSGPSPAP